MIDLQLLNVANEILRPLYKSGSMEKRIEKLKFKAGNASNSMAIDQFSNAEIQLFKLFNMIHD